MDVNSILEEITAAAVSECFGDRVSAEEAASVSMVETPRDPSHGDVAVSAAMKLAKTLRTRPLDIATKLADAIRDKAEKTHPGLVGAVEVAPPGFINLRLGLGFFRDLVKRVAAGGYGRSEVGKGIRVNLEFVSTNPTGPLTVAHGRQAAVGDSLAKILEYAGFEVSREYYLNDTGGQVRMLGASVFSHYADAAGGKYPFPENGYRGEYIEEIGRELFEKEGKKFLEIPEQEAVATVGRYAVERIMEWIRADLAAFRVSYDTWFSQKEFEESGEVDKLMERLREKGLAYEKDGAVWMRVSDYGDEKDRVLIKSDGDYTYRTPDIAYHENKFGRGFDRLIDILGPDHHGHIITMEAAMRAIGHPVESFHGLIVQFCSLWRGAEKLKMSTRAGQFITLREVVDEVGIDATRYFFAARKTDAPLEFDMELAKKQSMDNPVYYIQYMSARISGVLETAASDERFAGDMKDGLYLPEGIDLSGLTEEEGPVLRCLLQMPGVIEKSAVSYEPHRLCAYLAELAGVFHNYYTRCRFVSEETLTSAARLYFGSAMKVMLREVLSLIGVTAPDKM